MSFSPRTVTLTETLTMSDQQIETVIKATQACNYPCNLVFKIREREVGSEKYDKFQKMVKSRIKIVYKNLYKVLRRSDVVILMCSTTGIEAMNFERPVIVFPTGHPMYPPHAPVFRASNEKELIERLNEVFEMFPPLTTYLGTNTKGRKWSFLKNYSKARWKWFWKTKEAKKQK